MKGSRFTIHKARKQIILICFIIYLLAVFWYTVLNRQIGLQSAQFKLIWSYKEWINGDWELGKEIMANIAMFIPFGFLLSAGLFRNRFIIPAATLFSVLIEMLQLFLMRGLFEWDDVISNTVGASIGIGLYKLMEIILTKRNLSTISSIAVLLFAVISLVAVFISEKNGVEADSTSREYCFQIDKMDMAGGKITLSGVAFQYDQPDREYTILIKSTEDGTETSLVTSKTARPDVEDYFECGQKNIGFTATGSADLDAEYEVFIKWPWAVPISTGVYVSSIGIHYVAEKEFVIPDIKADYIENGILRVFRPDKGCWVYQWKGALYWVVDEDFYFEENGSTYIQYQLWTTQTDKLPRHRLDHNWLWDNIGDNFEDYELHGEFGSYRVMKREIPTTYPVTAIVTGYYKNGAWTWKEYFRPIYEFE